MQLTSIVYSTSFTSGCPTRTSNCPVPEPPLPLSQLQSRAMSLLVVLSPLFQLVPSIPFAVDRTTSIVETCHLGSASELQGTVVSSQAQAAACTEPPSPISRLLKGPLASDAPHSTSQPVPSLSQSVPSLLHVCLYFMRLLPVLVRKPARRCQKAKLPAMGLWRHLSGRPPAFPAIAVGCKARCHLRHFAPEPVSSLPQRRQISLITSSHSDFSGRDRELERCSQPLDLVQEDALRADSIL